MTLHTIQQWLFKTIAGPENWYFYKDTKWSISIQVFKEEYEDIHIAV